MIDLIIALEAELDGRSLPPGYRVTFCGVGKINAALTVANVLTRPDCRQVINFGTAGSLRPALAGQLVRVRRLLQRDMDAPPLQRLAIRHSKRALPRALLILVVTESACRQATISLPPRPRLQVTLSIWRPMPWQRRVFAPTGRSPAINMSLILPMRMQPPSGVTMWQKGRRCSRRRLPMARCKRVRR